jgi:hypothetical protein
MWEDSFSNGISIGIGISHIHFHAEWCADAVPLASTLHKTINNIFTQSIIHVPVELELLAHGTIPLATASASAASIVMLSGVPMPFYWPPYYTKQ